MKGTPLESSCLSRSSVDQGDFNARKMIMDGKTSVLDRLFPFYDHFHQSSGLPILIHYLGLIIFIIQFYTASFFVSGVESFPKTLGVGKVIHLIIDVVQINTYDDFGTDIIVPFIIFTVLFVLIFLFLVAENAVFYVKRRFYNWTFFFAHIFLEFLNLIILVPVSHYCGDLFVNCWNKPETAQIVYLVFSCIYWAVLMFLYSITSQLYCSTAFIQENPLAAFRRRPVALITLSAPIFGFLTVFLDLLADWACLVLVIFHLALMCYICYELVWEPFIAIYINSIFFGVCVACGFSDFLVIICYFTEAVRGWPVLIVSLVLGIAGGITFHFVEKNEIKKMKKILTYQSDNQMTDEEKTTLYEENHFHRKEHLFFFALRVGIAEAPDLFVDWSLIKYAYIVHDSNSIACLCILFLVFFPGESRLLNNLFSNIIRRHHLQYSQRFLLYQINKIRSLRASSSSNEAAEKLSELMQTKHRTNDIIRDFWLSIPSSTTTFTRLASTLSKSTVLWQEAIKDYPNSTRIAEEYSQFLIDCATDFVEGIRMKRRCELIDCGKNFSIDLSFKSFVRTYPHYLKKGIIGVRGNLISKITSHSARGSISSNSADKSLSASTSDSDFDMELEEQLGQTLFTHSRTRIALQRALQSRESKYIRCMKIAIIIGFLVSVVCFILSYVLITDWFANAQESLNRQLYAAHARFTASVAMLCLALQWGKHLGKFDSISKLVEYNQNEDEWQDYIDFGGNLKEYNVLQSTHARNYFGQLLTALYNLAQTGVDVYLSSSEIISRAVPTTFCDGDYAVTPIDGPLASMFSFNGFMRTLVAGRDESEWANLSYLCYSFSNAVEQTKAFNNIYSAFYDERLRERDNIWEKMMILVIIIPISMVLIDFLPSFIFVLLFHAEMKKIPTMLREIDNEAKKDAANSLCQQSEETSEVKQTKESKETFNYSMFFSIFTILIVNLVPIALIIGQVFYCKEVNERFAILHGWLYHCSTRAPLVAEITMSSSLTILARNGLDSKFVSASAHYNTVQSKTDELVEHNDALIRGLDDLPPCYDYDEEVDRIHYLETCNTASDGIDPSSHDSYRCASLNQNIVTVQGFINDIIQKVDQIHNLDTDSVFNLIHIANNHMFYKIQAASDRIAAVSVERHNTAMTILVVFLVCGLVLSVLIMITMFYISKYMSNEFSAALVIIRRVQPQYLISDTHITNYLLNRESKSNNFEMSLSHSVIYNSDDAVLCLGRTGIIEIVNPAVTKLFGFTPEQLLGQQFSTILAPESAEAITNQVTLMRNGQSAPIFQDHTKCISDNDTQIPCYITILGIKNEDEISSIALILRDETADLAKQQEAEEAKKQSEHLLYQILPQDIVLKLNQGEKDISFSVPSASIIFIDIVRFSDYMATLNPQQIMNNLSLIFAAYDEICAKYPIITKIKLIGDVYMAASGLFSPDDPPKNHAEAIIKFGLDAINELDDINLRLNSNLAVRVGVNSGGPVLAGVLGTDKPVFDIIGDTINVASRLQSTDLPGQVQISQGTYDLVSDSDFFIEPRGEVFLKGKGKQMAYFVKPNMTSVFRSSEFDFTGKMDDSLQALQVNPNNSSIASTTSLPKVPSAVNLQTS